MAGRVARVDRKALEPLDIGPLALDDQGRHAIGRGLDGDHKQDERREEPPPHDQEGHEGDSDDRRNHVSAGQGRPDPRDVLLRWGAVVGEPLTEVLVGLEEPADRQQHMDQEQAEKHHQRDEKRVPREQRDDEHADRVRRPEPLREAIGETTWPRFEHGWHRSGRRRRRGLRVDAGRTRLASRRPRRRVYPTDTWVKHFAPLRLESHALSSPPSHLTLGRNARRVPGLALSDPCRRRGSGGGQQPSASRPRWSATPGFFGSSAVGSTRPLQPGSRSRSRSASRSWAGCWSVPSPTSSARATPSSTPTGRSGSGASTTRRRGRRTRSSS